jgi:DNA-binding NarL/FixJ family response regulator
MQLYKAIVVDSHRMFADGFCELLKKKVTSFNTVDSCYSISIAKQRMQQKEYDYLFTDVVLNNDESKDFIKYCHKEYPSLIIIAVSGLINSFDIKELLNIGINAYLAKSASSDELQVAVERTSTGEKYISVELAGKLATALYSKNNNNLTKKELEVLRLVAKGLTIAEAAESMHLSQHTIIGHRRNIMLKLGVRSATEIVKYAYENNLY